MKTLLAVFFFSVAAGAIAQKVVIVNPGQTPDLTQFKSRLVSIARFKPTAFQAVSFQRPC